MKVQKEVHCLINPQTCCNRKASMLTIPTAVFQHFHFGQDTGNRENCNSQQLLNSYLPAATSNMKQWNRAANFCLLSRTAITVAVEPIQILAWHTLTGKHSFCANKQADCSSLEGTQNCCFQPRECYKLIWVLKNEIPYVFSTYNYFFCLILRALSATFSIHHERGLSW